MNNKIDKDLILNRIKLHYNFKTDVKLAEFLGLKTTTLANWNKRGSLDYDRLFTKCEDLNPNWIIYGIGNPHKNLINQEEKEPLIIHERENIYGQIDRQQEEIDRLNKTISIQEKTIEAQVKTIAIMELLLADKK
jgi:hypothetical protein